MISRLADFWFAKSSFHPSLDYHNHSLYPEFLLKKEEISTPATKSILNTADIGILLTRYQVSLSTGVAFPGLVNLVPAVAPHFCLNLPRAFLQPGKHSFGDLCIVYVHMVTTMVL